MRTFSRSLAAMLALVIFAPHAQAAGANLAMVYGQECDPEGNCTYSPVTFQGVADYSDLAPGAAVAVDPGDEQAVPELGLTNLVDANVVESGDNLVFSWHVVDIPDVPLAPNPPVALPRSTDVAHVYWDFIVDADGLGRGADTAGEDQFAFSLRVNYVPTEADGLIQSFCTLTGGSLYQCSTIESVSVTAAVDAATDTVTASVKLSDLRDYKVLGQPAPNQIAVTGATLTDDAAGFASGPAACVGVVLTSEANCDKANLDAAYRFGKHIEAVSVAPGAFEPTPEEWPYLLAEAPGIAAAQGAGWSLAPTPFAIGLRGIARACNGNNCSDIETLVV